MSLMCTQALTASTAVLLTDELSNQIAGSLYATYRSSKTARV
jgi:hypothetical protein